MRPVLLVALLPCLFALAAPVQRISPRPFNGTNAILLSVHRETAEASVRRLTAVSEGQGYTVDILNEDRLLMTTADRPLEPTQNGTAAPVRYRLIAFVVKKGGGPTVVELWGTLRYTDASGRLVERNMQWDGPRDHSPAAACFGRVQQFAQAFPAEQLVSIRYTKEKALMSPRN